VVILDNASVHKAKEIGPLLKVLQGKVLRFTFCRPTVRNWTASKSS